MASYISLETDSQSSESDSSIYGDCLLAQEKETNQKYALKISLVATEKETNKRYALKIKSPSQEHLRSMKHQV